MRTIRACFWRRPLPQTIEFTVVVAWGRPQPGTVAYDALICDNGMGS